eukprot:evm.model.scf_344.8 EVM.evm.TU.scf_344.8   scf_344:64717-69686(-)
MTLLPPMPTYSPQSRVGRRGATVLPSGGKETDPPRAAAAQPSGPTSAAPLAVMAQTLAESLAGIGEQDGRLADWREAAGVSRGAHAPQASTSRNAGDEALRLHVSGRAFDAGYTSRVDSASGPTGCLRWPSQGGLYSTAEGEGTSVVERFDTGGLESSFWSQPDPDPEDGAPGPSLMDDVGDELVRIKAHALVADHGIPGLLPIQPDALTEVPLWLAIRLAACDRCELLLPQWVQRGTLQDVLLKEASSEAFVPGLPFYYYEFFRLLWAKVRHVFVEGSQLLGLVEQIHTQRLVKADRLVAKVGLDVAEFCNLGHAELRKVRPVVQAIMEARSLLSEG